MKIFSVKPIDIVFFCLAFFLIACSAQKTTEKSKIKNSQLASSLEQGFKNTPDSIQTSVY
jgi:biopolymer transport protein ExbD